MTRETWQRSNNNAVGQTDCRLSVHQLVTWVLVPVGLLAVCLSINISIYSSGYLNIRINLVLYNIMSLCLSIFRPFCHSAILSLYLAVFLFVCLHICLSCFLYIYPLCESVCLSVCQSYFFHSILHHFLFPFSPDSFFLFPFFFFVSPSCLTLLLSFFLLMSHTSPGLPRYLFSLPGGFSSLSRELFYRLVWTPGVFDPQTGVVN